MRALLDVNVLIALHDRDHVHHERAAAWLEANITDGWASCPLTQNGCLRIMSHPSYSGPQGLADLARLLQRSTASPFHALWHEDISILDSTRFHHRYIHNHRQLTDIYLLGLAVKNDGRLVTFDRGIVANAVAGATQVHLVQL